MTVNYTPLNQHQPQRLEGESFEDYKLRRHNSNLFVRYARAKGNKIIAYLCQQSKKKPLRSLFSKG